MTCPACGAPVGPGARFCASCGRALQSVDDERRVVTVVFADLVGFTALSERLDPERVKNLVDGCFDRLAADITAFGGQVDKVVGDAIVALFGAPTAHEDDAERAVRAALRMQQTLADEAAAVGQGLQMRVGVNTGEVLVGAMRAAGSVTAMGDVVNTASRLQGAAAPGEVLVGPATHAATERTIAYEHRGLLAAKGREAPVDTWRALAPTLPPGYRARRDDVPLVGRDHELGLLRHALGTSIDHQRAALVLLLGDVGLGKSRLADEVVRWATKAHGATVREGRCVPYGEANVWWPVADALRDGLGVSDSQTPDEARAVVQAQVAAVLDRAAGPHEVDRTTDGLLTLLGHEPPPGADPATVRGEAGRALGVYAGASADRQPLVLQLTDLQWADDAVLGLIDDVFDQVHHRPAVVLATARPSLLDRWTPRPGRHNILVLHLDPLRREAGARLLHLLVGRTVASEVVDVVLDRSGGNPLYLEELVSLLDPSAADAEGAGPAQVAALPDTLRGLVAARLDDLDPAVRAVLQDAAVIGQRGPVDGLREMARQLGRVVDVDVTLAELVAQEIMALEEGYWSFRSDLVREVSYQTITKAERAIRHLGIATYLEHEVASKSPRPAWLVDQLAHHYGCAVNLANELGPMGRTASFPADLAVRARPWVLAAAHRARRDRALPTAVRLYAQAINLLMAEPAAPVAELIEVHLARAAAASEAWELGPARADIEAATALARSSGDDQAVARALVVQGDLEQREGDIDLAVATLTTAVEAYDALGDHAGRADALRHRAMTEIIGGRAIDAEVSATEALALFEELGDQAGQAWAYQHLAWIAFTTGRPDDADRRVDAAISRFADLADTRGMAWSLGLLGWIRFQQHRVAEAAALGDQVLADARSRSDHWATAMMLLLLSSIRLWTGHTAEAVELAEQALRIFDSLGDAYGRGQAGAGLGRALVMAGRVDEGLAVLAQAEEPGVGGEGTGGGKLARFARAAVAVQLGEPERADDVVAELEPLAQMGGDDPRVVLGLLALQQGDVERATRYLLPSEAELERHAAAAAAGDELSLDPNLLAARALLAATGVAGAGDAAVLARSVQGYERSTYLDRSVAAVGAALASVGIEGSAGAGDARRWLAAARTAVDGTGDRLARAVVDLAEARVLDRLGDPGAADAATLAHGHLEALGTSAVGWFRIADAALRPVPT